MFILFCILQVHWLHVFSGCLLCVVCRSVELSQSLCVVLLSLICVTGRWVVVLKCGVFLMCRQMCTWDTVFCAIFCPLLSVVSFLLHFGLGICICVVYIHFFSYEDLF